MQVLRNSIEIFDNTCALKAHISPLFPTTRHIGAHQFSYIHHWTLVSSFVSHGYQIAFFYLTFLSFWLLRIFFDDITFLLDSLFHVHLNRSTVSVSCSDSICISHFVFHPLIAHKSSLEFERSFLSMRFR
ncbi:hypothetical protein DL96DRAFT_1812769 [Flagelloscypha sp. PMI_526]|nr:hypothetical protein DL96DRAFT_1812769 [Flagelloscypha sp. PMI_526]